MPLPSTSFLHCSSSSSSSSSSSFSFNIQQTVFDAQEAKIQSAHAGTPATGSSAPSQSNSTTESSLLKAWHQRVKKGTGEEGLDEEGISLNRILADVDSSIENALRDFHDKVPEDLRETVIDNFRFIAYGDDAAKQKAIYDLADILRDILLENNESGNGKAAFKSLLKMTGETIEGEEERTDTFQKLSKLFKFLGETDCPEVFRCFVEHNRAIKNRKHNLALLGKLKNVARKHLSGEEQLKAFGIIINIAKPILPKMWTTIDRMKAAINTVAEYGQRVEALDNLFVTATDLDNIVKRDAMRGLVNILPFIQEDRRLAFLDDLDRFAKTISDDEIKLEVTNWVKEARAPFLEDQSGREQTS